MDDATLAEWEKDRHPSLTITQERLREAIAEIRRLREEPNIWIDVLKVNLAAHRAVVRELADKLEEEIRVVHRIEKNPGERAYCRCGLYVQDNGLCRRKVAAEATLAHPLAQQARREGRG